MKIYKLENHKEIYENETIVKIISNSMFNPTIGRIKSAAESIYSKEQGRFYVAEEDDYIGILGIKRVDNKYAEILHIAVDQNHRNKGIASELIKEIIARENVEELRAETNDDLVKFYKKQGFKIKDEEDPITGIGRYYCVLKI